MYVAEKEDLFAAIKSGGIYFDALFAVMYDELAEIDRCGDPYEVAIYKDDKSGSEVNFFVLTDDKCGNVQISAYIKTEDSFDFLRKFIDTVCFNSLSGYTLTVTDYYGSYVNDRIADTSGADLIASDIYTPFCCFCPEKTDRAPNLNVRIMDVGDESLTDSFKDDPDDYLESIFAYSVKDPVYERCGIYGVFANGHSDPPVFAGYLAFYSIEKYLDVSYVYVAADRRRQGVADALMSAFLNYCDENSYIPYYSNADGEESKRLAEKYGFASLGERIEYKYNYRRRS